jgi:hypothetical protein
VGLNREKTRQTNGPTPQNPAGGSELEYQVYFHLSTPPLGEWRAIFEQEWKGLNPSQPQLWQATSVDRGFLVLHCTLQEIAIHLPALKNAVANTNKAFEQYVREKATKRKIREDVWKEERRIVDEMAESLVFD